jgi:hypothetical protein
LFVLVKRATLLELLQSDLEFLLRINKILLVSLLLLLEELALAFPKSLISVIVAVDLVEVILELVHLPLKLHHILRVGRIAIVEGCTRTITHLSDLLLQQLDLLFSLCLDPPLLVIGIFQLSTECGCPLLELLILLIERELDILERLPLLLVLVLPELLLRGDPLDLRLGLVLHVRLQKL